MKICAYCGSDKDLNEFGVRTNGRLNAKCKACVRAYSKRHYENNRKEHIKRSNRNTKTRRAAVRAALNEAKSIPCADCGQEHPSWAMDFDHLDRSQKRFTISNMTNNKQTDVRDEIAKCDVVCALCHRYRTFGAGSTNPYIKKTWSE